MWRATRYNMIFMISSGALLILFAPQIVGFFSKEPEILRYGVACLRILGLGYPLWAVGMVVVQAMNGAGDTRTPTALNFVCFWMIEIPVAWWLSQIVGLGAVGVFWSTIVAELALTIASVQIFRRGKWKLQKV